MSKAIQLARRGRYTCRPNPQVGCVITRNGNEVGHGWHQYAGQPHAEINALNDTDGAEGSRVYVTLEPCSHHGRTPPCLDALIDAKVSEVIVAMLDPNPKVAGAGKARLEEAGITVRQGLLEEEARKLNPGFIKRMLQGVPFIRCKLAMSIDARTALANGESQWISSAASRKDVHRLRADCAAIMTTVETVVKDDPSLTVRNVEFEHKQPLRVINDRQLRTPENAKLLSLAGKTIIYTEQADAPVMQKDDVDIISIPSSADWLHKVMQHLASEYEVNDMMVECGGTFASALLQSGLVDELVIYMAPKLLGSDAQPLVHIEGITDLEACHEFKLTDVRQFEDDLRLTYIPN